MSLIPKAYICAHCNYFWSTNDTSCPKCGVKPLGSSALSTQEGGNHYKTKGIQPVEYIQANNLDFFQGNVVKYVTRHKDKNGKEDIKKAIHYLQFILELQYGE